MRLAEFNESDSPEDGPIDVTEMLSMPSDLLRGMFADLTPGSASAASVARLLRWMATLLTGERLRVDGTRLDYALIDMGPEQASQRAVEFIDMAEELDGIGGVHRDAP